MLKHLIAGMVLVAVPLGASASAIIDNGVIQLGVDDFGQLNVAGGVASPVEGTTAVGLRHVDSGYESTSHGCLCEGWGVGIGDTLESGVANNAYGVTNLTSDSFVSTATTATSVVTMGAGSLQVTHAFAPAVETPDLVRVTVSIENTSGSNISDLRYTRVFDWDIEPTAFSEFVTIGGTAAASAVLYASDDGFSSGDPFDAPSSIDATGDFIDSGPNDHGARFDFGFGALAAGDTKTFEIFYGATYLESDAYLALNAVSAEVFSFGQASTDPLGLSANGEVTFIFGFAGVGGVIIPPPPTVPVPAAGLLLLTPLAGAGIARLVARRRKS